MIIFISGAQIIHKNMAAPLANIRIGTGMPAKHSVISRTSSISSNASNTINKCFLVNLNIRTVENKNSLVKIDIFIPGAHSSF